MVLAFSPAQTKEEKAKLTFTEHTIKMGELYPGVRYERKFVFKNTGSAPLIITDIETACGCTVVKFSKEPVMPGKEGEILVDYIPKEDYGFTSKSFVISSNAENATEYIYLQATIVKKDKKKK
jgi:hypothetical protein